MSSLVTVMEKATLSNLAKLTLNQYLVVTLEDGEVMSAIAHSRRIGRITLGLSTLFTSPYVSVEGERTEANINCLNRLKAGLPCTVQDNLVPN